MRRAVLGFEDCSAKVTDVSDQELNANTTYVKEHEKLGVKGWSFYGFNVSVDDYQVVVNLSGEKDDTCEDPPSPRPLERPESYAVKRTGELIWVPRLF